MWNAAAAATMKKERTMQLVRSLKITPEEFFDAIETSVLYDIEQSTGKRPKRDKLNGFKYEKVEKGSGKDAGKPIKVRICAYRFPSLYEVRFKYSTGANTMRYEVEPDEDGNCLLVYTETYKASIKNEGFWGKVNTFIYERRIRSRARKTIDQIASYAIKHRRTESNPLIEELESEEKAD